MSVSSSEDEIDEALKESANCDYIKVLVNASKKEEQSTTVKSIRTVASGRSTQDTVDKGNDFEHFLAQRLAGRLDEKIKIVERKRKETDKAGVNNGGIRLFSSSPVVSELKEDDDVGLQKRRKTETVSAIDYDERAGAAAVTPDWVKDVTNTAHWKDNKKTRVLETTVIKKHANGVIECSTGVV